MKLGIVGLPNVGKSTLFNSLTKAGAESANYPFCTKSLSFGCTFYKTCDVNELDDSRCYFLGLIEIFELLQTLVRNRHDADIRVNGTERIVCRCV